MADHDRENSNVRIGDLLKASGLVTEEQIRQALAKQATERKRLGELLIEIGAVSETDFAQTLANQLNLPFIELANRRIDRQATELFPKRFALKHLCVPVERDGDSLLVAMADPLNLVALDDLEWSTRCRIKVAIAVHTAILDAIERGYPSRLSREEAQQLEIETEQTISELSQSQSKSILLGVLSNKGGVGKTHLSINVATCLAQAGSRVLLIDADLGNADVQIKVGVYPKHNLLDFLEKKCTLEDTIIETEFGFNLIGGASGEFKLANMVYSQKVKFMTAFRDISKQFDVVILDLSAGITRSVLDFALAADDLVLVTTPQDIVAGYACLKAAFYRMKELELRLFQRSEDYVMQTDMSAKVIFNRVNSMQQGIGEFRKMKRAIEQYTVQTGDQFDMNVEYVGAVPFDSNLFVKAEQARKPVVIVEPDSKVTACFRDIAQNVVTAAAKSIEAKENAKRYQRFANFILDSE